MDETVRCGVYSLCQALARAPSSFDAEMDIGKLKGYKVPCTDGNPTEVFQAPGKTVCSEINKPTNFM
jgi:hypothetical protein